MKVSVDTSVLVAALIEAEPHHIACRDLLAGPGVHALGHSLVETFSTLTGGRLPFRLRPAVAAELIEESLVSAVQLVALSTGETLAAFREAEGRGARGAAIYDYLHLAAARKVGAVRLYTLDLSDFSSLHRPGDPEIVSP